MSTAETRPILEIPSAYTRVCMDNLLRYPEHLRIQFYGLRSSQCGAESKLCQFCARKALLRSSSEMSTPSLFQMIPDVES